MEPHSLTVEIAAVLRANRIRFGDVRRIERALPMGLADAADAEMLLALDRAVARTDAAWIGFLVRELSALMARHDPGTREGVARSIAAAIGPKPTRAGASVRGELAAALAATDPDLAALFAVPARPRTPRRARTEPRMAFAAPAASDPLPVVAAGPMAPDAAPAPTTPPPPPELNVPADA